MARPKKDDLERRDEQVKTRFTSYEKALIEDNARKAGLSLAEYVRRLALGHQVYAANGGSRGADPELVRKLDRLGGQVRDLGNVTNQVAVYCHTDRPIPAGWEVLPREVLRLQEQISETLDQVVLSDGS